MLVATTKGRLPQRSWSWISLQLRSSTFSEDGLRGCPRMQSIARVRTASRLWSSPLFCGAEPLGSTKPTQSTLKPVSVNQTAQTSPLRPLRPWQRRPSNMRSTLPSTSWGELWPTLCPDTFCVETRRFCRRSSEGCGFASGSGIQTSPCAFLMSSRYHRHVCRALVHHPVCRRLADRSRRVRVGRTLLCRPASSDVLGSGRPSCQARDLMRVGVGIDPATGEEHCSPETGAGAFSTCMQIFSRLNAGERGEMPNVRWCVLKALSMYAQMPRSVVAEELEHDYADVASSSRIFVGGSEVEGGGNEKQSSGDGSSAERGEGGGMKRDHLGLFSGGSVNSNGISMGNATVDIEGDRRLGHFSPNPPKKNKKKNKNKRWANVSSTSPGRGSIGDVARKLSSLSQMSDSVLDQTQETVPISRVSLKGDGGRTVSPAPSQMARRSPWMVEDSCVTVDLRKCDEASHQWLVRDTWNQRRSVKSPRGESEDPHFARRNPSCQVQEARVRGAFSPSKRGARSRSALGRGKSPRERNKRTSFCTCRSRLRAPKKP